jgi:hypothetical protein
MKKKIISIIIALAFIIGVCPIAKAETITEPGTLPDSIFYFAKLLQENLQLLLVSGGENKIKQILHIANVRFAEYEKMLEKNKSKTAYKTLDKFTKQLDKISSEIQKLKDKDKDTTTILQIVKGDIQKDIAILQANYSKASDSEKESIQKAINAIQNLLGIQVDTNTDTNTNNNITTEQKCINAGGTVKTMNCCKTASDFPNLCLIGACGCALEASKETKICDCGDENKCFNGEKCVARAINDTTTQTNNTKFRVGASLTLEQAKAIALRDCGYPVKEQQQTCNSNTGTWWFDLDVAKAGCNPACVVNLTTKTAEINWRCTGLIVN